MEINLEILSRLLLVCTLPIVWRTPADQHPRKKNIPSVIRIQATTIIIVIASLDWHLHQCVRGAPHEAPPYSPLIELLIKSSMPHSLCCGETLNPLLKRGFGGL